MIDELDYDPETDCYRTTFDADAISASAAVVAALSSICGSDPSNMDPLYESIDTDSLNAIVESGSDSPVSLSFEFDEFDVTVTSDGTIEITPPESPEE